MSKRLYRSKTDRKIGGVCGGLAEYFNIDPTIVRIIFVILLLPGGLPGFIPYIILWIVVPEGPDSITTPPPDKS
jgi:phage shock protein C